VLELALEIWYDALEGVVPVRYAVSPLKDILDTGYSAGVVLFLSERRNNRVEKLEIKGRRVNMESLL
jgi:hypothetical protein